MSSAVKSRDRWWLWSVGAVVLLLVVAVVVLAPSSTENDPRPTTYNSGSAGAKAAFLLLQAMGRSTDRWDKPLQDLSTVDAQHTTLVLAEPEFQYTERKDLAAQVQAFLERGGRVLTTDAMGASLLPDGDVKHASKTNLELCETVPEGPGELARAGEVELNETWQWGSDDPRFAADQRCGSDAVVVHYAVSGKDGGQGAAVWWASATPLTNAGLKKDGNLRLLLASVGDGRTVLFDDSLLGAAPSMWDEAKGLPLTWLKWQVVLTVALLLFTYSRRNGPVRAPVSMPRSSPVEFADSMGDLYAKAGATNAATDAARRRLLRVLVREAGLAQATVAEGPEAIADALHARVGGDWMKLSKHLRDAQTASQKQISQQSALALVQALCEDAEEVRKKLKPAARVEAETTAV